MEKNKKIIESIVSIMTIAIILPLLIACIYAIPAADDYSNVNSILATEGNRISVAFRLMISAWNKWQGTYFGCFLIYMFTMVIKSVLLYKIFLVANILLFVGSIYLICKQLGERMQMDRVWMKISYLLVIVALCGFKEFYEIFYWLTGACVYTIPLSVFFLGMYFFCNKEEGRRKGRVSISGGCLFLAAGGSLQISALVCATLLFLVGIEVFNRVYKITETKLLFLVALIGALLNAVAPGNFVRHSNITETLDTIKAVMDASLVAVKVGIDMCKQTPVIWIFLFCFLFSIVYHKWHTEIKTLLLEFVCAVLTCFVVAFPVVLGYNGTEYFPNRCEFILYVAFLIHGMIIAVLLGSITRQYLFKKDNASISMKYRKLIWIVLLPVILRLPNFLPATIIKDLVSGKLQGYSAGWEIVYDKLQNTEDKQVVILKSELPENISYFMPATIEVDWVKNAMAVYFEKESIVIEDSM